MAARSALVVVEHIDIDGFANRGSRGAAGRTTEQGTHEGASQPAKEGTGGAGDHAKGGTGFGAPKCSSSTTGSPSGGAHGAPNLAGVVMSGDLGRVASGASRRVSHIGLMKMLK